MNLFRRLVFIITVSLVFCGCKNWSWWPYGREGATKVAKGSIYENLEKRGNYSLFLKAVDMTGYKQAMDKSSLLTVFAPDDNAFEEFMMEELEVADLSDVALDYEKMEYLRRVVAYHVIQFAYTVDDFLGFTMSSDPEAPRGNGSAYRYQTLAREPIEYYEDPLSHRQTQLYKREKFLPVYSTNLFKNKKSPDIEGDFRQLYPDVNWQGDNNRLYVGDAAVIEQGIPADNGYLYTIDKVAVPQPTIYELLDETLGGELAENHKYFAQIIQRLNRYTYDADVSKLYAIPGDSLYYHYTFLDPASTVIIPQIASEWTYIPGKDGENNIERSMSYTITAMIPNDDAITAWIEENLTEWIQGREIEQVINELPLNTLYHFVIAHLFGKREIIIPSQLTTEGVVGAFGEVYLPTEDQIEEIKVAANGVVYCMKEVNTPNVMKRLTRPLFTVTSGKSFRVFAEAFNAKDMYMLTADASEKTLFVVSDANLQDGSVQTGNIYRVAQHATDPLKTIVQKGNRSNGTFESGAVNDHDLGAFMAQQVVGQKIEYVPWPEDSIANDSHYLRYFTTVWNSANGAATYLYQLDGEFYSEVEVPLLYVQTYSGEEIGMESGTVHEVAVKNNDRGSGKNIREAIRHVAGNGSSQTWKPGYLFKELCKDAGVLSGEEYVANGWNSAKDLMVFMPSNEAIEEALAAGPGAIIPYYDPEDEGVDADVQEERRKALERWCKFYFFDRFQNNLTYYTLQGLDPYTGISSDQPYEYTLQTGIDVTDMNDAVYCKVGWDPNDCMRMYLENASGDRAYTLLYWPPENEDEPGDPELLMPARRSDAGICFVIDKCFSYSEMISGEF